jgi:hypothetical protein
MRTINKYKFILLAYIFLFTFLLTINNLVAQSIDKSININDLKIQENEWECGGLLLDTAYNSFFHPNPCFIKVNNLDTSNSLNKYTVYFDSIYYNQSEKKLIVKGTINGGEFGGWGSEVFLFAGSRLDSTIVFGAIHGNDFYQIDTHKCFYLKEFDYCYTNCAFEKTIDTIVFNCALTINSNNDILIFARNNYYAEIFDLKKLLNTLKDPTLNVE